MAEESKISWCDSTWNPWLGCTRVSPACDNCYAASWALRAGRGELWNGQRARTKTWNDPPKWQKHADFFHRVHGRRQRVFTASLADFFDKDVPEEWRAAAWSVIEECNRLDWFIVTKRISNFKKMLPINWDSAGYKQCVLIITVVTQQEADRDIPRLLDLKREWRWLRVGLSIEPMLEHIELDCFRAGMCMDCCGAGETAGHYHSDDGMDVCEACGGDGEDDGNYGLDWVITGGESGGNARPMEASWVREIRDWCAEEKVPFHHKQNGEFVDGKRIGKERAGRLLDGVQYDGFPAMDAR